MTFCARSSVELKNNHFLHVTQKLGEWPLIIRRAFGPACQITDILLPSTLFPLLPLLSLFPLIPLLPLVPIPIFSVSPMLSPESLMWAWECGPVTLGPLPLVPGAPPWRGFPARTTRASDVVFYCDVWLFGGRLGLRLEAMLQLFWCLCRPSLVRRSSSNCLIFEVAMCHQTISCPTCLLIFRLG